MIKEYGVYNQKMQLRTLSWNFRDKKKEAYSKWEYLIIEYASKYRPNPSGKELLDKKSQWAK